MRHANNQSVLIQVFNSGYLIPLFQLDEKKKLINIATIVMTVVNVSLNILFIIHGMGIRGISRADLLETVREGSPSAFKNVTSIIFNTAVNNIIAVVGTTAAMAAFSLFKMTKFIFLSVSEAMILKTWE